jgi:imidazoleglycerol-phosphate dehydratase/histidinol-phosphatase
MQKPRILFLDRDGCLIHEPPEDYQVDSFEKLSFLPGVLRSLVDIKEKTNYRWVMVTNQDGLGTDSFPEDTFWPVHNLMLKILEHEGIVFDEVVIDRTFARDNAPTRKPETGLLTHYLEGDYDLENSLVIGDRYSDMKLAQNLGAKGIMIGKSLDNQDDEFVQKELESTIVLKTDNWKRISRFITTELAAERKATISRTTKETEITVSVNLDGTGKTRSRTGVGFFDHMLDQLGKHSKVDLEVEAKGDLHIDAHHTIEDVAIVIGEAFYQALGDKRGIERYGFFRLPMDDALAEVALDFSGRAWLVWEGDYGREKVGDLPVEMVYHFFKSFSDHARCNLNVKISGENAHHMIEATFKGVARAIRAALTRIPGDDSLPTTKGLL